VSWTLLEWWTGLPGWQAEAEATLSDIERTWEREQIEGEALYWPSDPCYLPAQQMVEEEYVAELPPVMQKAWGISMDCLNNWTHGCGTEMGVAALEYWVEIDSAVRAALAGQMTPTEAMLNCKEKVQAATDRAWDAIDEQE
jgi:hypothetical protein